MKISKICLTLAIITDNLVLLILNGQLSQALLWIKRVLCPLAPTLRSYHGPDHHRPSVWETPVLQLSPLLSLLSPELRPPSPGSRVITAAFQLAFLCLLLPLLCSQAIRPAHCSQNELSTCKSDHATLLFSHSGRIKVVHSHVSRSLPGSRAPSHLLFCTEGELMAFQFSGYTLPLLVSAFLHLPLLLPGTHHTHAHVCSYTPIHMHTHTHPTHIHMHTHTPYTHAHTHTHAHSLSLCLSLTPKYHQCHRLHITICSMSSSLDSISTRAGIVHFYHPKPQHPAWGLAQ